MVLVDLVAGAGSVEAVIAIRIDSVATDAAVFSAHAVKVDDEAGHEFFSRKQQLELHPITLVGFLADKEDEAGAALHVASDPILNGVGIG